MVAVVEDEASDAAALVVPTATADAGSPASSMPTVAQDATSGIRRDDIALCFIFGPFPIGQPAALPVYVNIYIVY